MSSIGDRESRLIISLMLGDVSDAEFFRSYPVEPTGLAKLVEDILGNALRDSDAMAVELGLHLAHRFGVRKEYLPFLLRLGLAPWHQRHEDVVDALGCLADPSSVHVVGRMALTKFPYRAYDEADSLAKKAVRVLRLIGNDEAVLRLVSILRSGKVQVAEEARAQLAQLGATASSGYLRALAKSGLEKGTQG